MFMQYRKELIPFTSTIVENDPRIEVIYPAADRATVSPGQDFYVIGKFHGVEVPENAKLKITVSDTFGTKLRVVETDIRDNYDGMRVDYPGLLTEMSKDEIRHAGMPDLVYDPQSPDSFYDTWNKAFYSKDHFAALIYGGTYDTENIHQYDQYGAVIKPLRDGEYTVAVEIRFRGEAIRTTVTLRIQGGTKEIVLSRYTSEEHSSVLKRFAEEKGLTLYSGIPYPGIWDTESHGSNWEPRAYIEIPDRWVYNDSLEYIHDKVYCFDYNLSSECVAYRTEIAALLMSDPSCLNDPERLEILYYADGLPKPMDEGLASRQFLFFSKDEYLAVTSARTKLKDPCCVVVRSVLKPIPSAVQQIEPSKYRIENKLEKIRYKITCALENVTLERSVGTDYVSPNGVHEWHLLQSSHELQLPNEWCGSDIQIHVEAIDHSGHVWDEKSFSVRLQRKMPDLVLCDVDGTLIDNSQLITPCFDILKQLIKDNKIPFSIATGRSPELIREYMEYLDIRCPVLVNNGAGAVLKGKLLWNETFPAKLVKNVIQAADKLDMAIFMCIDDQELVYRYNGYIQREMDEYERYNHFFIPLESEWDGLRFERLMITDPEKPGRIDEIIHLLTPLRSELTIIRYDDRHVDVMNRGVSKGWAIRRLAKMTGIDPDNIMVIGDGENDIEMVKEVGMGIAVGNAKKRLKDNADYICKEENTKGVIEAVKLFM